MGLPCACFLPAPLWSAASLAAFGGVIAGRALSAPLPGRVGRAGRTGAPRRVTSLVRAAAMEVGLPRPSAERVAAKARRRHAPPRLAPVRAKQALTHSIRRRRCQDANQGRIPLGRAGS